MIGNHRQHLVHVHVSGVGNDLLDRFAGFAVLLNDLLDLPQAIEERAIFEAMSNAKRNDGKRSVVGELIQASSKPEPVLIVDEDVVAIHRRSVSPLGRE